MRNLCLIVLYLILGFTQFVFAADDLIKCKVYLKSKFFPVNLTIDKKTDDYIAGRLADGAYVTYFKDEIRKVVYSGPEQLHLLPTARENALVNRVDKPAAILEDNPKIEVNSGNPSWSIPEEKKQAIDNTLNQQEENDYNESINAEQYYEE